MASPPKPWEKPGVNRQMDEGPMSSFMSSGPSTFGLGPSVSAGALPAIGGGDAPALPTRPSGYSNSYSPGYSSMSSYGGGYGGGSYGSPYSSMYSGGSYGGGMLGSQYSSMYSGGGYGGGMYGGLNRMGAYGTNQNEYNSFARLAEESSRPAFQSIESIVGAFSSVSMMLDSTFQAVYNSFRAVVGVADNFGRMKTQFAQIFAAFTVFKWLKYLYRKLLVLMRLRPQGFAEEAWHEAGDVLAQSVAAQSTGGKKSTWPVIMFFAIIMGGPWLIWKFLQSTLTSGCSPGWANGSEDHFVATALYDFNGEGNEELSFKAGSTIHVAPKEIQPRIKGWLLASVDGKQVGLVPGNYMKVMGKRRGTNYTNNQTQSQTLPNEQSQGLPNDIRSQSGPQTSVPSQMLETGLNPSPSAVDLQNEIQGNMGAVGGESYSNQELDSIFNTEGTLPTLPEESNKR